MLVKHSFISSLRLAGVLQANLKRRTDLGTLEVLFILHRVRYMHSLRWNFKKIFEHKVALLAKYQQSPTQYSASFCLILVFWNLLTRLSIFSLYVIVVKKDFSFLYIHKTMTSQNRKLCQQVPEYENEIKKRGILCRRLLYQKKFFFYRAVLSSEQVTKLLALG